MNQSCQPSLLFITGVVWVERTTKVRHYWGLVWYSGASTSVWSWLIMEVIIWRGPSGRDFGGKAGAIVECKNKEAKMPAGSSLWATAKAVIYWDRVAVEAGAVSFLCCLTLLLNIRGWWIKHSGTEGSGWPGRGPGWEISSEHHWMVLKPWDWMGTASLEFRQKDLCVHTDRSLPERDTVHGAEHRSAKESQTGSNQPSLCS